MTGRVGLGDGTATALADSPIPFPAPTRAGRVLACLLPLLVCGGCASKIRPVGTWGGPSTGFAAVNTKHLRVAVEDAQEATWAPFYPSPAQLAVLRASNREYTIPSPAVSGLDPSTSRPMLLVIAEPQWAAPLKMDADDRAEIQFVLRERLYRYALRAYPHPVRVRWAYDPRDPLTRENRVVTLESRITDLGKGSGLARYLLGFGIGSTSVQFEGEFIEGVEKRRRLGAFVVRTSHAGYSQWGMNPQVYLASYCAKYAVETGVWSLMERLPEHLPGAVTAPAHEDAGLRIAAARQAAAQPGSTIR